MSIFIFLFQSCKKDSESIISNDVESFTYSDLDGTWIFKGNSNTMILFQFEGNGFLYSDDKTIEGKPCEIIEYRISGNNYEFKGRWGSTCWSSDDYIDGKFIMRKITFNKAHSYIPDIPDDASGWYYVFQTNEISNQSKLLGEFKIERVSENTIKISKGDMFYVGNKVLEYTVDEDGPMVMQEYVDLGLSVNWAKCNMGAQRAEEYGYYVGWGDPTGTKTSTNLDDYPCPAESLPTSICGTSYDIARIKWGNEWRMPSIVELHELTIGCTMDSWYMHHTYNGVYGVRFVGITGKCIFFPLAGYKIGTSLEYDGRALHVWSGSLNTKIRSGSNACSYCSLGGREERNIRGSVRAVKNK